MTRVALLLLASAVLMSFGPPETAVNEVSAVLDELHASAARGDGDRYFELFAPAAVFIGTDAAERWPLSDFRVYAAERFEKGSTWTYRLRRRNVFLSPDGYAAWFDETLDNDKYGLCRGTGVLVRIDGRWRIAQYHLTIPVPNELALEVVGMIRDLQPPLSKD